MKQDTPPITFSCRFHPTNWWHEVGCFHREWSKDDLKEAIKVCRDGEKIIKDHTQLTKDQKYKLLEEKDKKLDYLLKKL